METYYPMIKRTKESQKADYRELLLKVSQLDREQKKQLLDHIQRDLMTTLDYKLEK